VPLTSVTVGHYQFSPWQIVPGAVLAALLLVGGIAIPRRTLAGAEVVALSRYFRWWLACPVLALAITVGLHVRQVGDFSEYCALARMLAGGGWDGVLTLPSWRPPGMAFALAPFFWMGLSDSLAVWLLNTLVFIAIVGLLSRLFRGVSLPRAQCVLVGIGGLFLIPPFLASGLSEIPAFALQMLALVLLPADLRQADRARPEALFLSGASVGIACLFRSVLLLQAPIMAFAVWRAHRSSGENPARARGLARAGLVLAGVAMSLAPWTLRNYHVFGRFLLISHNGGEVFYSANSGSTLGEQGRYIPERYQRLRALEPDPLKRDRLGFRLGLRAIASHPLLFAVSLPYRAAQMLGRAVLWPASYLHFHADHRGLPSDVFVGVVATALLTGSWLLLSLPYFHRAALKRFLYHHGCSLWPYTALGVLFFASIMFECAGRYTITLIPCAIAVVADALREARC
jgi:hypothetical protein